MFSVSTLLSSISYNLVPPFSTRKCINIAGAKFPVSLASLYSTISQKDTFISLSIRTGSIVYDNPSGKILASRFMNALPPTKEELNTFNAIIAANGARIVGISGDWKTVNVRGPLLSLTSVPSALAAANSDFPPVNLPQVGIGTALVVVGAAGLLLGSGTGVIVLCIVGIVAGAGLVEDGIGLLSSYSYADTSSGAATGTPPEVQDLGSITVVGPIPASDPDDLPTDPVDVSTIAPPSDPGSPEGPPDPEPSDPGI